MRAEVSRPPQGSPQLRIRDEGFEHNRVDLQRAGPAAYLVRDRANVIDAGPGCRRIFDGVAYCEGARTARVDAGRGDDSVDLTAAGSAGVAYGGSGDDRSRARKPHFLRRGSRSRRSRRVRSDRRQLRACALQYESGLYVRASQLRSLRARVARVTARCQSSRCRVRLKLRASTGRQNSAGRALGEALGRARRGQRLSAKVRLNRHGRQVLRRRRRLRVRLLVAYSRGSRVNEYGSFPSARIDLVRPR